MLPIELEAKAIRARLRKLLHTPVCIDCGKLLTPYHYKSQHCRQHAHAHSHSQNFHEVVQMRQANPHVSATEIAQKLGISRERVRQLLVKNGLPTKFRLEVPRCAHCGRQLRKKKTKLCWDCFKASHWMELICEVCHQPFQRRIKVHKQQMRRNARHIYCSKKCQGKWLRSLRRLVPV